MVRQGQKEVTRMKARRYELTDKEWELIRPLIPISPKVNTKQPWPFDKEMYKRRNVIERFFNRLKEFRRAETRYDKRDDSFLAFVMVAAICVAFSILHI